MVAWVQVLSSPDMLCDRGQALPISGPYYFHLKNGGDSILMSPRMLQYTLKNQVPRPRLENIQSQPFEAGRATLSGKKWTAQRGEATCSKTHSIHEATLWGRWGVLMPSSVVTPPREAHSPLPGHMGTAGMASSPGVFHPPHRAAETEGEAERGNWPPLPTGQGSGGPTGS